MHLRLESFDGPMDLLLHLIKTHEINIFNIPMTVVVDHYMSYIQELPEIDFAQAGEYLAMAAQLLEIKAALLIPALQKRLPENMESLEDIPEEDPRKELVAQLLSYEVLKKTEEELHARPQLGFDVWESQEHRRIEEDIKELGQNFVGNPYEMVIAFERLLLRFNQNREVPKVKVRAQKITIQQKIAEIYRAIKDRERFVLQDILFMAQSRYELIVTFMAVLELCKANHLLAAQDEPFGPIVVTKGQRFGEEISGLEDETTETRTH